MMKVALSAVLFLALLTISFAQQEPCNSTADCRNGFCKDYVCEIPVPADYLRIKACNVTAQCYEGYCYLGQCIVPTASTKIFDLGVKSGCAGLFSGSLGGIDIIVCNAVWLLLMILAGAAAYLTRSHPNKLVPVFAFIAPVGVGMMFYPFLGVIICVLELMLLIYKGGEEPEEKEGEEEPVPEAPAQETPAEEEPAAPQIPRSPPMPPMPPAQMPK